jgi:short-subunit dehydrogenase
VNCLIIGGSSGLGLSLANKLADHYHVIVTGRRDPGQDNIQFETLDLSGSTGLQDRVDQLVKGLPDLDLLVYAAGFYQEGTITELSVDQIHEMLNVGLAAALFVTRSVLAKQGELDGFIAITSTSQWTPRLLEPVYTAVKAGLGAFANSLSLDPRVKKTLVAGPAGMATKFWEGTSKDTSDMLDPDWVADETLKLFDGTFSYKYARILRSPARVELQEERDYNEQGGL